MPVCDAVRACDAVPVCVREALGVDESVRDGVRAADRVGDGERLVVCDGDVLTLGECVADSDGLCDWLPLDDADELRLRDAVPLLAGVRDDVRLRGGVWRALGVVLAERELLGEPLVDADPLAVADVLPDPERELLREAVRACVGERVAA